MGIQQQDVAGQYHAKEQDTNMQLEVQERLMDACLQAAQHQVLAIQQQKAEANQGLEYQQRHFAAAWQDAEQRQEDCHQEANRRQVKLTLETEGRYSKEVAINLATQKIQHQQQVKAKHAQVTASYQWE